MPSEQGESNAALRRYIIKPKVGAPALSPPPCSCPSFVGGSNREASQPRWFICFVAGLKRKRVKGCSVAEELAEDLALCARTGWISSEKPQTVRKMKTKKAIRSMLLAAFVASFVAGCATQDSLKAQAKISEAEAGKIALEKVPGGIIKETELEKEKGKLVWSFEIATPGNKDITEVEVDAVTGGIVSVEKESDKK
jgi:uncharacterized membrane protein YkoI